MPETKETLKDGQPFYNVMPELNGGVISKPKITSTTAKPPVGSSPLSIPPQVGRSRKKLFTVLGVVLVLILGGAGIWFYFFNNQDAKEEVKSDEPVSDQPANPDVTNPGEWLARYFGSETCTELVTCADKSDPDRDGLDNKAEYDTGTDPNNNDSDKDGIADGDESLIFHSEPLISKTYTSGTYDDAAFVKGGYDVQTNEPYTNERLFAIKAAIKEHGLHQPTLTTLGTLSFQLYEFKDPTLPPLPADLDLSPQAKLDRDSQRQATIKKIGAALIKYQTDKKSYPPTDDFVIMADLIKSFNSVATNYNDPIAREPYVYGYNSLNKDKDFVLTYYSETQNQLIKYFAKDAATDAAKDTSKVSDEKRKADLESIQQALLIWSSTQLDPNSDAEFVFPTVSQLKASLVPRYLTQIPTDPVTKLEYQYQVGPAFDTFTIKAVFQNPAAGTTGWLCNQEECKAY